MLVTLVNATELTQRQVADWSALQRQVPVADSPFFCPQFTRLCAEMWNNVEVAVLQEGDEHIGFFPFERSREQVAKPVASVINDFHGVVARHDPSWTVEQLLQAAGIKTYEFDHLPQAHSGFDGFMTVFAPSPYIDLSEGFQKYCDDRRAAGSKTITKLRRKLRNLERDLGSVRLEFNTTDYSILGKLIEWKAAASKRAPAACIAEVPWFEEFAERLCATQQGSFAGTLSVLYAGETPVAAHLGMRSSSVLHWWFPSYDNRFAKYSPGVAMLYVVAERAAAEGIRRIDLGKGKMEYKESMKSGDLIVTEGIVDTRPWVSLSRRSWLLLRDRLRHSRFRQTAHRIDRVLTRGRLALGLER